MTALSFEFFPTKTDEGARKLQVQARQLADCNPEFLSVTYGAGGSTRNRTRETLVSARDATGIPVMPHLACIGHSKDQIQSILKDYKDLGISRIIALRGDRPSGIGTVEYDDFQYASQLVAFIREETGDHFHIEIAAYPEVHPQARSMESDLDNFRRKIEAGASSAITQYFFNPDGYYYFMDRIASMGINVPVVPGVMPITNYMKLARFSDACGAEMPRWLRKQLEAYGDDSASIRQFGEEVMTGLCEKLVSYGVPALHFYTLNQAGPSMAIVKNLNLA
ncbi:methylenetetrahydrofolate reductase [NAD(P)H] [Sansalvadorimonas sp. 2012CJ34-2]|uniref:Methylenetetrahydrofolate reductase n=1 Tax=Parendozoicomonas callyspongiae TaxID=2942213 RepID=A0ABT0PAL7_9GAMM|nr:methylenetetrahydrofolate reductase [NAD(P)H] [Sansalvadorimonas sp. 2012CJ34-2]MCL6268442.1 methylenetetrahydrofolate reductase [NAD(P)H] [Sansalvadorimonas sp. 2012CJ34-2]